MINKKIEIKIGGDKVLLWFNNFAVFELQKIYGVDQNNILTKVSERANENYLLLLSDLIKVGVKGHSMARGLKTPDFLDNLTELVAVADLNELMEVWNVFYDIMGGNTESDKKKVIPKARAKKQVKKKS